MDVLDNFFSNIFHNHNNGNSSNNSNSNSDKDPSQRSSSDHRSMINSTQQQQQVLQHLTNVPSTDPIKIPAIHGMMLLLDNTTGELHIEYEPDANFESIHPNCYAPACLQNCQLLHGGGSGTAVFEGYHPYLQQTVIMKHANHKDSEEVFGLAMVSHELLRRSKNDTNTTTAASSQEAAEFVRARIPQFVYCYISPHHVRDRASELWHTLRVHTWRGLAYQVQQQQQQQQQQKKTKNLISPTAAHSKKNRASSASPTKKGLLPINIQRLLQQESSTLSEDTSHCYDDDDDGEWYDDENAKPHLAETVFHVMKQKMAKRELWVRQGSSIQMDVKSSMVIWTFPLPDISTTPENDAGDDNKSDHDVTDSIVSKGYETLAQLSPMLAREQERRAWKCTLAQTRVGGPHAENGATVLLSKRLSGQLLQRTVHEFVQTMQYLRQLTLSDEEQGVQAVRKEVQALKESNTRNAARVSQCANEFCGTAIWKNFKPSKGRFPRLRQVGQQLRAANNNPQQLFLTPSEKAPASFLGRMLQPGASWADLFDSPPGDTCVLDAIEVDWMHLLELATQFENHTVTNIIWTCGLTDAGLHNTFISKDRGLELFDLGKPQLMPMPAFLTKFLMSFFHILGMEEEEHNAGGWVCRFRHDKKTGKLLLTDRTKSLIPYVHKAFAYVMDHMITEVFDGDDQVRELLLTYTVYQLVSDASFCLEKWETKGGGHERVNDRNMNLSKWLWRSIWDLYIATNVYETLLRPMRQESNNGDGEGSGAST